MVCFKEFYDHGSLEKGLNATFLVLIPKKGFCRGGNLFGWNGTIVGKRRAKTWRAAPLCLMWTLWKEKNGRAFNDVKWTNQAIKYSFFV